MTATRSVSISLLAVILSLLIVGLISGTLVRHVIQVLPPLVALVAVRGARSWGRFAALPIFIVWLLIMVLIWLYLLGITDMISGQFTGGEIVLTFVIGLACGNGLRALWRDGGRPGGAGWFAEAGFLVFQVVAMWVSMLPGIVND